MPCTCVVFTKSFLYFKSGFSFLRFWNLTVRVYIRAIFRTIIEFNLEFRAKQSAISQESFRIEMERPQFSYLRRSYGEITVIGKHEENLDVFNRETQLPRDANPLQLCFAKLPLNMHKAKFEALLERFDAHTLYFLPDSRSGFAAFKTHPAAAHCHQLMRDAYVDNQRIIVRYSSLINYFDDESRLYVSNLATEVSLDTLYRNFIAFGQIRYIRIPNSILKSDDRSRSAVIRFVNGNQAAQAMDHFRMKAFDFSYKGRGLQITRRDGHVLNFRRGMQLPAPLDEPVPITVVVRNLLNHHTQRILEHAFQKYQGDIQSIVIREYGDDNKYGYAHVNFFSEVRAAVAVADLNGKDTMGFEKLILGFR